MKLPRFKIMDHTSGREVTAILVDNSILSAWRHCQQSCFFEFGCSRVLSQKNVHLYWGAAYHEGLHLLWGKWNTADEKRWDLEAVLRHIDKTYNVEIQNEKKTKERLLCAIEDYANLDDPLLGGSYREYALSHPTVFAEEFIYTKIMDYSPSPQCDIFGELISDETVPVPVYYCGLVDRGVQTPEEELILIDYKHTTWNRIMDAKWSLDPQFIGYVWLVNKVMHRECDKFMLDLLMMQGATNKFHRRIMSVPPWMTQEWERRRIVEIQHLLDADSDEVTNSPGCSDYGTCPYFELCSVEPDIREVVMETMYVEKVWRFNQNLGDGA